MADYDNCGNFGSGGLEEADVSTQGSPEIATSSPTPFSGSYRLGLLGNATQDQFITQWSLITNPVDDDWLSCGFWIQFNNLSPTTAITFLQVGSTPGDFKLRLATDGDLELINASGALVGTATTPFTVNTWERIEVIFRITNTGAAHVFLNGTEIITVTSSDFDALSATRIIFQGGATSGENVYIDSWYTFQDTSEITSPLGDFRVSSYQPSGTGITENGRTPDAGSWANAGEVLWNDSNIAEWTADPSTASAVCDGTVRSGPSGDITATDVTHGAKWIERLQRDGGAGSTHFQRYGNDVDSLQETADLGLTTSLVNYFVGSSATNAVPLAGENFEYGIRISGAQDMKLSEGMAYLLHTPAAVTAGNPMLGASMIGILGG